MANAIIKPRIIKPGGVKRLPFIGIGQTKDLTSGPERRGPVGGGGTGIIDQYPNFPGWDEVDDKGIITIADPSAFDSIITITGDFGAAPHRVSADAGSAIWTGAAEIKWRQYVRDWFFNNQYPGVSLSEDLFYREDLGSPAQYVHYWGVTDEGFPSVGWSVIEAVESTVYPHTGDSGAGDLVNEWLYARAYRTATKIGIEVWRQAEFEANGWGGTPFIDEEWDLNVPAFDPMRILQVLWSRSDGGGPQDIDRDYQMISIDPNPWE